MFSRAPSVPGVQGSPAARLEPPWTPAPSGAGLADKDRLGSVLPGQAWGLCCWVRPAQVVAGGGRETGVTLLSVEDLTERDVEGLRLGTRVLGIAITVALALIIVVGVVLWSARGEAGEIGGELDRQRLNQYQHTDVVA